MKIPIAIAIFIVTCFALKAKGQSERIVKDWVKQDSIFIGTIVKAYKANPANLEQLLSYKGNQKDKLGFGYFMVNGGSGKGYVSISCTFIYYGDKLVSFLLSPEMPNDRRLTAAYQRFYSALFEFDKVKPNHPQPLCWGYNEAIKPLPGAPVTVKRSDNIDFFMMPYSGTLYGDYGGIVNTMLENRAVYQQVRKEITPGICELLLYSINPAARLTAIEYYYRNEKQFTNQKKRLENRIKTVYKELPNVATMSGCEELDEKAEELVNRFANRH